MYALLERIPVDPKFRLFLDPSLLTAIGLDEAADEQVVQIEVEGGAIVIRGVPPESADAALREALAARERKQRRREDMARRTARRGMDVGVPPEDRGS